MRMKVFTSTRSNGNCTNALLCFNLNVFAFGWPVRGHYNKCNFTIAMISRPFLFFVRLFVHSFVCALFLLSCHMISNDFSPNFYNAIHLYASNCMKTQIVIWLSDRPKQRSHTINIICGSKSIIPDSCLQFHCFFFFPLRCCCYYWWCCCRCRPVRMCVCVLFFCLEFCTHTVPTAHHSNWVYRIIWYTQNI